MLYDDDAELEVRHVIFLAHYRIELCGDEGALSEGDLFVKRNSIRLSRKLSDNDPLSDQRPFFLFSDNSSEKEDFYHALIQGQDVEINKPTPLAFGNEHLIKLIQQIHESEENLQTRWLNALLGRLFLALYKTKNVEDYIESKISKKISRVRKPTFISNIQVRDIDLGDSFPLLINQKLSEMRLDGDLTLEADLRYSGGFKLEIAATVRIELGSRFKAREVGIIVVGMLKKLEGHVFVRIKPPPSNRIWVSFETMPQMSLAIEPVVSSRQITYGIIIRAIESRIREVVKETLVMPNWDDIPFFDSIGLDYRGGLWAENQKLPNNSKDERTTGGQAMSDVRERNTASGKQHRIEDSLLLDRGKSMSVPILGDHMNFSDVSETPMRKVESLDYPLTEPGSSLSTPRAVPETPETSQIQSSAITTSAMVSKDSAAESLTSHVNEAHHDNKPPRITSDQNLYPLFRPSVSTPNDLTTQTVGPPDPNNKQSSKQHAKTSLSADPEYLDELKAEDMPLSPLTSSETSGSMPQRQQTNSSMTSAIPASKKWSWNVLSRPVGQKAVADDAKLSGSSWSSAQPIGRGRPLPPPGVPLPGPQKAVWTASSLGLSRRKPLSSTRASSLLSLNASPPRSNAETQSGEATETSMETDSTLLHEAEKSMTTSISTSDTV